MKTKFEIVTKLENLIYDILDDEQILALCRRLKCKEVQE